MVMTELSLYFANNLKKSGSDGHVSNEFSAEEQNAARCKCNAGNFTHMMMAQCRVLCILLCIYTGEF